MKASAESLFSFDKKLKPYNSKKFCLIGIDEAGRGPLAGPVVASAVFLPPNFFDPHLNDSKQLSAHVRKKVYHHLIQKVRWSIGSTSASCIDSINVLQATYSAMRSALSNLLRQNPDIQPDLVIVDGRPIPHLEFDQRGIIKGDSKSASIAAASVIAKVWRDKMMTALDRFYPQYGFSRHKGYGTEFHIKKLREFGPSPYHRKTFAPMKEN
jgi:ribonuclease HII